MFGKKSGLNAKLRNLLARIQREFDAPRVYAVRCHIKAGIHTYRDPVSVRVKPFEPPLTRVNDLAVEIPLQTCRGALDSVTCNTMVPLSELTTETRDIPCWQVDTLTVHAPEVRFEAPPINTESVAFSPAPCNKVDLAVATPAGLRYQLLHGVRVRGNLAMARQFPFRLRVIPMKVISTRLLIRYRTGVLKKLNVKPTQVKFVGVSFGLPRLPLNILKYDGQTTDGYDYVEARPSGAPNPQLGRRVWVFIRMMDEPHYIPVTLKEE